MAQSLADEQLQSADRDTARRTQQNSIGKQMAIVMVASRPHRRVLLYAL